MAVRRARVAVAVLFFTNGALFANLLPRYPQIKEALGIGNAGYGLAVAAFPAGAVAAGLAAGVVIRRLGSARAAVAGTLLTAAGIAAAGFSGSAGFGVATLVPAAMHEADELPGLKPGSGLALVSWLMRLGFLLSPPLVGLVADAASLRAGLLVVPFAGVLVLLLAGVLQGRRDRPGD